MNSVSLDNIRHPDYLYSLNDWQLWRYTYEGGDTFVEEYLQKFTKREKTADFNNRKEITPIPAFAKAAINDIRNAIYQRMVDVTRKGGSRNYQLAIEGKNGGVNMQGTGMDAFIGFEVLTELLIMGRVGVYIDNPIVTGTTLADSKNIRPYLYTYPVENILSWARSQPDEESEFKAILLKDRVINYTSSVDFDLGVDVNIELPKEDFERYRLIYIDKNTGLVNVKFYNMDSEPIDPVTNEPTINGPIELQLTRIPFVMFDIKGSLLKDVCKHQVALLNLCSSDVAYALKANFPFYTEQQDNRGYAPHLKQGLNPDNTASEGGQEGKQNEIEVGAVEGRQYGAGLDRPGFIHPSSEPLKASIQLQEKLEDDIRKLVNLAVANKTGRPISGESKEMDNQGLEAGLSFIGLILETGERTIADYWATYENINKSKREIATIKYPARYSLKKDIERIEESQKLTKLMTAVPGRKIKRELAKIVVSTLLSGKISVDELEQIYKEIDESKYTTSDPEIILKAFEAGLSGGKISSVALGFEDNEYSNAEKDHLERIKRVALSQTEGLGARGITDLSVDNNESKLEKEGKPTRGQNKSIEETE